MTYEYLCTACGHEWEADQSITAAPLRDCPSCKAAAAQRQVSGGTGFVLKGGGWYADLYGSAKPTKKDGAEGKTEEAGKTEAAKDAKTSGTEASTPAKAPEKPSTPSPKATSPAE